MNARQQSQVGARGQKNLPCVYHTGQRNNVIDIQGQSVSLFFNEN